MLIHIPQGSAVIEVSRNVEVVRKILQQAPYDLRLIYDLVFKVVCHEGVKSLVDVRSVVPGCLNNIKAEPVEGCCFHINAELLRNSFCHFLGRFFGKCNEEYFLGFDFSFFAKVFYFAGNSKCFTTTCTCEDKTVIFIGHDNRPLLIIKRFAINVR